MEEDVTKGSFGWRATRPPTLVVFYTPYIIAAHYSHLLSFLIILAPCLLQIRKEGAE